MKVFGYSTGIAAAILFDESRKVVATYGCETSNPREIEIANSAPGTVFSHTLRGSLEARADFQPEVERKDLTPAAVACDGTGVPNCTVGPGRE